MKNAILAILSFALLSAADYSIDMKESEGKAYHLSNLRVQVDQENPGETLLPGDDGNEVQK